MKDIVEIQKNQDDKSIMYVRFERLKENDFILLQNTIDKKHIIYQHIKNDMDLSDFLNKVYDFEMNHNKSKNRVFALSFEILLPFQVDTKEKKEKFIKSFKRQLFPDIAIFLNCFVYETVRGKGTYLTFIIFERQYIGKVKAMRYDRDYHTYKKIEGIKVKIKTRNRNQIKKDAEGKKMMQYVAFGDKLRFFNFPTVEELKEKLIDILESSITKVFTVKYANHLRFKRKLVHSSANKFKRLVALEINQLKHYIETKINKHYRILNYTVEQYDILRIEYQYEPERIQLSKIVQLFNEIAQIFDNNFFKEGNMIYEVNYRYVKLPQLKISLQKIKNYFNRKFEIFEKNI